MDEQHVYHHNVSDGPKVNVKVEKNSRGYNFEVTVTGANNVEIVVEAETKLKAAYGQEQAQ